LASLARPGEEITMINKSDKFCPWNDNFGHKKSNFGGFGARLAAN